MSLSTTTQPLMMEYEIPDNITWANLSLAHVLMRYPTWIDFYKHFVPSVLYIDRYMTIIWYVIGIIGNSIAFKIWMERRMRHNNSSAVYLAALSISDFFFILFHMPQELSYAWGIPALSFPVWCESYFLINMALQYLSPLLVLGFTVERYISVVHPFQREKYCTTSRAIKVVITLIIISLLMNAVQTFFWSFDGENCDLNPLTRHDGPYAKFRTIYSWTFEMLMFAGVPLLVLIFNILVICEIRKILRNMRSIGITDPQGSSKNTASTVMLVTVALYLIVTTLPVSIVYTIDPLAIVQPGDYLLTDEEISRDQQWNNYFMYITTRKVVEEICLSHYACNFFLYMFTGVAFRNAFLANVRKLCPFLGEISKSRTYLGNGHANHDMHECTTLTKV